MWQRPAAFPCSLRLYSYSFACSFASSWSQVLSQEAWLSRWWERTRWVEDRIDMSVNILKSAPWSWVSQLLFRSMSPMRVTSCWELTQSWLRRSLIENRTSGNVQHVCMTWIHTARTECSATFAELYAACFAKYYLMIKNLSRHISSSPSHIHRQILWWESSHCTSCRCHGTQYTFKCVVEGCSSHFSEAQDLYPHVRTAHILQWRAIERTSRARHCPLCHHNITHSEKEHLFE